jgi:predicted nucleic acid-binding protein
VILYLDTSSLVKLYLNEADSEKVRESVTEAEIVVTCRIACPEFHSALTRRRNNNEISKEDYEILCKAFDLDWERLSVLDFDERQAGTLVRKHGLRGADAVHLSSVMQLAGGNEKLAIAFSSSDRKLNDAAAAEGFSLLPTAC